MKQPPDAIRELMNLHQWVCWKYETPKGKPKPTKVPYQVNHRLASSTDPDTWTSYDRAAYAVGHSLDFSGVGFVVSRSDPYCGIDLDGCLDRDGRPFPWAKAILLRLDSYTEISPSGRGLRIWIRGDLPEGGHKKKWRETIDGDEFEFTLEMYDTVRFFTVTGTLFAGTPDAIHERQAELAALHAETFPPKPVAPRGPDPLVSMNLSDTDRFEKACHAANGSKFLRLWNGDIGEYNDDDSAADLALCNLLRYWWGRDPAAIDRMFRQSRLMREKWDEPRPGGTWGSEQIDKACDSGEVYDPTYRRRAEPPAMPPRTRPTETTEPAPEPQDPARFFPHTDYGNAERLVARHGQNLRFTLAHHWLLWRETHWEPDRTQAIMRRAKATVRAMYTEAGRSEDEEIRKALAAWARKSESSGKLKAMVEVASSEPGVCFPPELFDADPNLLNLENGTIDLTTGTLREHRREDAITKLIPIRYDPRATCPRWDRFLAEITAEDAELVAYLQRAVGYSLTGDVREQNLFFLYGGGANGKGTFLEILQHMLGEYATTAAPGLLLENRNEQHPTAIADLAGRRAVISSEIGEGKRLAEELVKRMTGGDRMKGRKMHCDFFEFRPNYKLWLMANHKPVVKGNDDGIWRRIHTIPFVAKFYDADKALPGQPLKDPLLVAALVAELPGILAWAVRGCLEWQRIGLSRPKAVLDATDCYREEMDVLGAFLSDCCVQAQNVRAKSGDLYAAYQEWCQTSGEHTITQTAFGRAMTERGFLEVRDRNLGRLRSGVGLLDTDGVGDPRLNDA